MTYSFVSLQAEANHLRRVTAKVESLLADIAEVFTGRRFTGTREERALAEYNAIKHTLDTFEAVHTAALTKAEIAAELAGKEVERLTRRLFTADNRIAILEQQLADARAQLRTTQQSLERTTLLLASADASLLSIQQVLAPLLGIGEQDATAQEMVGQFILLYQSLLVENQEEEGSEWSVIAHLEPDGQFPAIERMRVPGGWMYRTTLWGERKSDSFEGEGFRKLLAQQTAFVPIKKP